MAQPLYNCTSVPRISTLRYFLRFRKRPFCIIKSAVKISPFISNQAMAGERSVGTIVAKLEKHKGRQRGYIAMLAVDPQWRGRKIGAIASLRFTNLFSDPRACCLNSSAEQF